MNKVGTHAVFDLRLDLRIIRSSIQLRDYLRGSVRQVGDVRTDTNQLENAIIAEGRRQQLRVISVDALLNLLELKQEYDLFQGKRCAVSTWKDATPALFEALRRRHPQTFEGTALTLQGRKRPYVTRDRSALRIPGLVPNTSSLYFETNLSANSMVKLCYTLLEKMGYSKADLAFQTE